MLKKKKSLVEDRWKWNVQHHDQTWSQTDSAALVLYASSLSLSADLHRPSLLWKHSSLIGSFIPIRKHAIQISLKSSNDYKNISRGWRRRSKTLCPRGSFPPPGSYHRPRCVTVQDVREQEKEKRLHIRNMFVSPLPYTQVTCHVLCFVLLYCYWRHVHRPSTWLVFSSLLVSISIQHVLVRTSMVISFCKTINQ